MFRKHYGYIFPLIVALSMLGCCLLSLFCSKPDNKAFASNSAYAVIRTDTFEILNSSNADAELPMASTTKIMTALIALENCLPDEVVTVDSRSVGIEGSSVYLREGEKLKLIELLYCMMLRSGNDAATAIALHLCDTVKDFSDMMNIKAESLGLKNTHFVNPHGLHDNNHYTSAQDLAIISANALQNEYFAKIVSTKQITVGNGESRRVLVNKNKMLSLYDGANGVKTGYTKISGRCLVSSATKNGVTLACVVLNVGDTYGLSMELLDKAFSSLNV